MRKRLMLGTIGLLGILALGADGDETVTYQSWFVELASAPSIEGTSLSQLQAEKNAFRKSAQKLGLQFTERRSFDVLFNGLSIDIDPADSTKLPRIAGVKAIYPVYEIALPPTAPSDPELATAIAMTGADIAQSELGLTGAGVRVGIIDTGVDYDHPDLGGNGVHDGTNFPNARIVTGWDFVGDNYNSSGNPDTSYPVPDPDPDDPCNGHGTHVAGIVGANGLVTGVAPGVTFGVYRVFGCVGTTAADIMIAAMEQAFADGVDVVNMSIGSSFAGWPQYPTARAGDRLVNHGVVVVASAGNSGTSGLYASGAPAIGNKVIGVASFDNTFSTQLAFTITPDDRAIGYNPATGAPPAPISGTSPLRRTGTSASTADACTALPAGSLSGRVALIRRGGCTFIIKATNARNAGATAVVFYNNIAGSLSASVVGTPVVTIPVVAITAAEGVLIDSRLAGGPVDLTWTTETIQTPVPTGGLISFFSSYGPTAELELKPDLGAPGGNIFSTWPIELGSYFNNSGTSMSSPHVAGAVALLLEARPNAPPSLVRTLLSNNAEPRPWSGNPNAGSLDHVHRQGAGLLHIDRAILATSIVEPNKLSLGESAGPHTRTLTIGNDGADEIYHLAHAPALSTGPNTFTVSVLTGYASVAFSQNGIAIDRLAVPAGATASFEVTITENASLPDRSLYGGYILIAPESGEESLNVPYLGFKGDYQSIAVLTPAGGGYPRFGRGLGASFTPVAAGATFNYDLGEIPVIAAHLDHAPRRIRFELFNAATQTSQGILTEIEYAARFATPTTINHFAIPNTMKNGRIVSSGQYFTRMSVQRALGDDGDPSAWETFDTPVYNWVITIPTGGDCTTTTPIAIGQSRDGTLAAGDCTSGARGNGFYTDRFTFSGTAGQRIAISTAATFDSYLYLRDRRGKVIAEDDDGGTGTSSRIPANYGTFMLPANGTYTIEVTSFGVGRTGSYTLTLSN